VNRQRIALSLWAILVKIGRAIARPPRYLWERTKLNFAIYLGRNSLKNQIRRQNRRIGAVALRYRMAIANLPYGEQELGFDTYWWSYSVQLTSQWLLNLTSPSRWRITRLMVEGTARFNDLVEKRDQDVERGDWGDRLWWWLVFGFIGLKENLADALLATGWFLYTRFLRHPRNSQLAALREQLRGLVATQDELVREIKRIISTDGEETPIAAQTRLLQERDKEAKRVAEERDRMNRFRTARENLTRAFEELRAEQAENPIDPEAQLPFPLLETYIQAGFAEMDSLVGEGKPVPGEEYIDAMERTTGELKHSFRFWAESVAQDRQSYSQVMKSLEHIEEDFGKFDPPQQVVRISYLFHEDVPNLWSTAEWDGLRGRLADIREMINQIADFAREFRNWGKKVGATKERVAKVEKTCNDILERYGKEHEVHPSQEWIDAWESFETKALPALAHSDWDTLNECLRKIEEPLKMHEYKVISGLEIAHRLATGKDGQERGEDMTRGTGTRHARARFRAGKEEEQSEARSVSVGE